MLKIGSWTLSNLCDGQPRPVLDVHAVIPALAKLLQHTDSEILSHTCWALSHLCDGLSTHIRAVVDADICWRLVELLTHRRLVACVRLQTHVGRPCVVRCSLSIVVVGAQHGSLQ